MKKLLCVIGPSGSGKSTYVNETKERMGFGEIISTTTRQPRLGEIDGQDYHFVSVEEFQNLPMIQKDEYAGHLYGTSQIDLDEAYQDHDVAFMVVTFEGAQMFQTLFQENHQDIEVVTIFVYTPIEELKRRMINRGDDYDKIQERIANIEKRKEYDNKEKTDYVFEVDPKLSLSENCQRFFIFIQSIIQEG